MRHGSAGPGGHYGRERDRLSARFSHELFDTPGQLFFCLSNFCLCNYGFQNKFGQGQRVTNGLDFFGFFDHSQTLHQLAPRQQLSLRMPFLQGLLNLHNPLIGEMVVIKTKGAGSKALKDLRQDIGKILFIDNHLKVRSFLFSLFLIAKIRGQHLSFLGNEKETGGFGQLHVLCPKTAEISPIPRL